MRGPWIQVDGKILKEYRAARGVIFVELERHILCPFKQPEDAPSLGKVTIQGHLEWPGGKKPGGHYCGFEMDRCRVIDCSLIEKGDGTKPEELSPSYKKGYTFGEKIIEFDLSITVEQFISIGLWSTSSSKSRTIPKRKLCAVPSGMLDISRTNTEMYSPSQALVGTLEIPSSIPHSKQGKLITRISLTRTGLTRTSESWPAGFTRNCPPHQKKVKVVVTRPTG